MGNPGNLAETGFSAFFSLIIPGGLAFATVAFFYARRLYRLNVVTVGDFFRLRYNRAIDTVVSVILVLSYPAWIASQLVALGVLLQQLTGMELEWGITVGAAIVVLYTYIGGMWAVSYTDMLQTVLVLVGLGILLITVLDQTGGVSEMMKNKPESFFSLFPKGGLEAWSVYIAMILALFLGSLPGQEIYPRVFSAKSESAAVKGLYIGALLIVIVPVIPALIGFGAAHLHPELIGSDDGQNLLPAYVSRYASLPVQILFYGALISAILSTSSGAMLAPATIIGENILKPLMPDKKFLLYIRIIVVVIALVSVYFALSSASIIELLVTSLSLMLVCIFAPFTFGLFWKRSSAFGAWCSILTGGVVWLACHLLKTQIDPTLYGLPAGCMAMVTGSLIKIK